MTYNHSLNQLVLTTFLLLQGCVAVVAGVGLAAGPTLDRGTNIALGGAAGNTITTDTAIARNNGSKSAVEWCAVFDNTVSWYDDVFFSQDSWKIFNEYSADHCERWRMYEHGELAELKESAS